MGKEITETSADIAPKIIQLIVFQLKLVADAGRDFVLFFLSFAACLADIIQNNPRSDSYFEKLLTLGRKSEKVINLFNLYDPENVDSHGIDAFISQMEEKIRKEYKEGTVSEKARQKLDAYLELMRGDPKNFDPKNLDDSEDANFDDPPRKSEP